MKKIISIVLAIMLCMALCVPAFAEESEVALDLTDIGEYSGYTQSNGRAVINFTPEKDGPFNITIAGNALWQPIATLYKGDSVVATSTNKEHQAHLSALLRSGETYRIELLRSPLNEVPFSVIIAGNTQAKFANNLDTYYLEAGENNCAKLYFTPEESRLHIFRLEAENYSVVMCTLYDENGNEIDFCGGGQPVSGVLQAGVTYCLEIEFYSDASKNCWVNISSENLDKHVDSPGKYAIFLPNGIYRSFYFTPSESGNYSFHALSEIRPLDVCLYNGESKIDEVYESPTTPAEISAELQANTVYRFEILSYSGSDNCVVTISKNDPAVTASTLSEGYLAIITAVAGVAIGFLAAMFIFKKKKPTAAE